MHVEMLARNAATLPPDLNLRQAHLFQILPRAQRMQPHAIRHLPRHAQHRLAHRRDRHRHHRQPVGSGEKSGVINVSV